MKQLFITYKVEMIQKETDNDNNKTLCMNSEQQYHFTIRYQRFLSLTAPEVISDPGRQQKS